MCQINQCKLFLTRHLESGRYDADAHWKHFVKEIIYHDLMVIEKGVMYIQIDGQQYVVREREFIICPPGCRQLGYKSSKCSFFWVHFVLSDISNFFGPNSLEFTTRGRLTSLMRISLLFSLMIETSKINRPAIQADCLCIALLNEISSQIKAPIIEKKSAVCENIQIYIQNNISDPDALRLNCIADYFGYSPKYIPVLFNKAFGISVKQYIIYERIERAKQLLRDTNETLEQISAWVGYASSHYFMSAFKTITGITPSEYRKYYKNDRTIYNDS